MPKSYIKCSNRRIALKFPPFQEIMTDQVIANIGKFQVTKKTNKINTSICVFLLCRKETAFLVDTLMRKLDQLMTVMRPQGM